MNNSLDLMRARLNLRGGVTQQDRMIKDKRETLDRVLMYSYQGANVRKAGSENIDRALMNPNSVKQDYDDKIISIGYEYGYEPGTVFEWVNTGTKWLIYLQDLTELAYFKGNVRKCNYEIKWKSEDGTIFSTAAAVRGPKEVGISSTEVENINVDSPNHSLNLLLPASKEVLEYFVRYSKFYLSGDKDYNVCWRVEAIDWVSMPGILEINAVEYYVNEIHEKDVQIKSLEIRLKDCLKQTDMWKKESEKVSQSFKDCKVFCPRESTDWNEYQEWWKEKHKDDIQ